MIPISVLFVIPARLASHRLPRKMLLPLDEERNGSVIQLTYEAVRRSRYARADNTIIATCDEEIQTVAEGFGAKVCMTSSTCKSGSDRVEEVARKLASVHQVDAIVNVQGDEPFVSADHIDASVNGLLENSWSDVATCAVLMSGPPSPEISKVKVVCANNGKALYFSRRPIPFNGKYWRRHIGIYAFRPSVLHAFTNLPPSSLEMSEDLEQLRLLENGFNIHVTSVNSDAFGGIDTIQDYERAKQFLAQCKSSTH